jgi:DNA polymerase-3 subunit chi
MGRVYTDPMAEVLFYHLERSRLEDVLPTLLERTLARGWRAELRVGEPDRLDALDDWLWTFAEESFLPHGTDADDPVRLSTGPVSEPREVLFLVHGAATDVADFASRQRSVLLFDEADADAARAVWKSVAGTAGLDGTYWRQGEGGKWERKG